MSSSDSPIHVVIIPFYRTDEQKVLVLVAAKRIKSALGEQGLKAEIDEREIRPGAKFHDWLKRGVPLRVELGAKDIASGRVAFRYGAGGLVVTSEADFVSDAVAILADGRDEPAIGVGFRHVVMPEADIYRHAAAEALTKKSHELLTGRDIDDLDRLEEAGRAMAQAAKILLADTMRRSDELSKAAAQLEAELHLLRQSAGKDSERHYDMMFVLGASGVADDPAKSGSQIGGEIVSGIRRKVEARVARQLADALQIPPLAADIGATIRSVALVAKNFRSWQEAFARQAPADEGPNLAVAERDEARRLYCDLLGCGDCGPCGEPDEIAREKGWGYLYAGTPTPVRPYVTRVEKHHVVAEDLFNLARKQDLHVVATVCSRANLPLPNTDDTVVCGFCDEHGSPLPQGDASHFGWTLTPTEQVKGPTVVIASDEDAHLPVDPGTNRRHSWTCFREAGMLWAINRVLHMFGWAVVYEEDTTTGETTGAYPVRTEWRGFPRDREDLGYERTSAWLAKAGAAISEETNRS